MFQAVKRAAADHRSMQQQQPQQLQLQQQQTQQLEQQQAQHQADDAPNTPLVFQCAKCRVIVGDSLSLGDADEAAQTITLSSASHVHKVNQVFTPHSGKDVGSSYFPIACSSCKTQLGKFYITTLRSLDHLREKYTFNIATLTSYALGQSEQGFNAADAVNDAIQGPDADGSGEHSEGLAAKVDDLSEEVVKIEHVMLSLTERVQTIEQRLAISYTATGGGGVMGSGAISTPSRLQHPMATATPVSTPLPVVRPVPDRGAGSGESKRQRLRS